MLKRNLIFTKKYKLKYIYYKIRDCRNMHFLKVTVLNQLREKIIEKYESGFIQKKF